MPQVAVENSPLPKANYSICVLDPLVHYHAPCHHQLIIPSLLFIFNIPSSSSILSLQKHGWFSIYLKKKKIYLLTLHRLHSPSCLIQPFWKESFTFTSTLPLDFSTPNLSSPQNEAIGGTAFNAVFLCPIPASCRNRSFKDDQWLCNYQTQWIFLSQEFCWAYSHFPMLKRTQGKGLMSK